MTEPHLITVFDEQVGADRLFDRRYQGGRAAFEHGGEQPGRESVRQYCRDPHDLAGGGES